MEQHGESSRSHHIFRNHDGSSMRIWLDPKLPTFSSLLNLIQANGGRVSTKHDEPDTRILILHPSSIHIFDRYCHPVWLSPEGRKSREEAVRAGEVDEEEWRRKVILTEKWPRLCVTAWVILGDEVNWGGLRKGGPPAITRKPSPIPKPKPIEEPITRQPQIAPISTPAIHLPPSPVSPPPERIAPQSGVHDVSEPEIQVIEFSLPLSRNQSRLADVGPSSIVFQRAPMPENLTTHQRSTRDRDIPPHLLGGHVDQQGEFVASNEDHTRRHVVPPELLERAAPPRPQHSMEGEAGITKAKAPDQSQRVATHAPPSGNRVLTWSKQKQTKKISRWQENGNLYPPPILHGLRFYVSIGRRGRKQTIKYLRQSGGAEVTDINYATHALLAALSAQDEQRFIGLMRKVTPKGVWSLPFEWLEASWDAGKLLPEVSWAFQGGVPLNPISSRPTSTVPAQTITSVVPLVTLPVPKDNQPTNSPNPMPTKDLDYVIRSAHPLSLQQGTAHNSVTQKLHRMYPQYSELTWLAMYKNWLKYAGPFRLTADDNNYKSYSAFFPRYLPGLQDGISLEDISVQMVNDNPTLGLDAKEWNQRLGNWLRAGGHFGMSTPQVQLPNTTIPTIPLPGPQAVMPLPFWSDGKAIPVPEKQHQPTPLALAIPSKPEAATQSSLTPNPKSPIGVTESISPILRPLTPPLPPHSSIPELASNPVVKLPIPSLPTLRPAPSPSLPPKPTPQSPPTVNPSLKPTNIPQPQTQPVLLPPKPTSLPEGVVLPPTLKRDVIARMFKLNFNSERHTSKHVAGCLAGMTSQTIPTLQVAYRAWRSGISPFDQALPADLAYTNDGKLAPARSASVADLDSQAHPTKRHRSS